MLKNAPIRPRSGEKNGRLILSPKKNLLEVVRQREALTELVRWGQGACWSATHFALGGHLGNTFCIGWSLGQHMARMGPSCWSSAHSAFLRGGPGGVPGGSGGGPGGPPGEVLGGGRGKILRQNCDRISTEFPQNFHGRIDGISTAYRRHIDTSTRAFFGRF